tara:strand:+ start:1148 stop:1408 length:261 start_codon:yes stop_codon:yes gene_type:complete
MSDKLKSRKFWFALLGAILPLVAQVLTEEVALAEALQLSVGILGAYIFGQAYVDGNAVAGSSDDSGDSSAASADVEEAPVEEAAEE